MLFRVFFVYSLDPATFKYGSTSITFEAVSRPKTWDEMQPVYKHIKETMGAQTALIFGLVTEDEFQGSSGTRQLLYSQGNHRPVKGKSDDDD